MRFSLIHPNDLTSVEILVRIFLAVVIGCVVGTERQYKNRPAGLRTHVLVCLGACSIALIECLYVAGFDENTSPHVTYNVGRLCAQVISGIGFLGAGIIFKDGDTVKGLTTAATVWCAAAIGCLCGYGLFAEAILGTVAIMTVNIFVKHLRSERDKK